MREHSIDHQIMKGAEAPGWEVGVSWGFCLAGYGRIGDRAVSRIGKRKVKRWVSCSAAISRRGT
jgi:hypothetical protein